MAKAGIKSRKMAKDKSGSAAAEVTAASGGKTAAAVAKPKVIRMLKADMKYRGAREAWYSLLQRMEGKTEAEFVEAAKEQPPSRTKKGEAEPPTGWFRFFERTGVIELK
jgi:hypothetical protein